MNREYFLQIRILNVARYEAVDSLVTFQFNQLREQLYHLKRRGKWLRRELLESDLENGLRHSKQFFIAGHVIWFKFGDFSVGVIYIPSITKFFLILEYKVVPCLKFYLGVVVGRRLSKKIEEFIKQKRGSDDSGPRVMLETILFECLSTTA